MFLIIYTRFQNYSKKNVIPQIFRLDTKKYSLNNNNTSDKLFPLNPENNVFRSN